MNTNPLPQKSIALLLAVAIPVLNSGCAGGGGEDALRSVRTVSVDPRVPKPRKMAYSDHGSAVTGAMVWVGVLPMLLSAGVDAMVASGGRKSIERAAGGRSITIEQIVLHSFTRELTRSGLLKLSNPGAADATFKLTIRNFGVMHRGGLFGSGRKSATVELEVALVRNNGEVLWESEGIGGSDKANWHYRSEYESNPELLRTGWDQAASNAAREIFTGLREELGLDEEAETPAEPAPPSRQSATKPARR